MLLEPKIVYSFKNSRRAACRPAERRGGGGGGDGDAALTARREAEDDEASVPPRRPSPHAHHLARAPSARSRLAGLGTSH